MDSEHTTYLTDYINPNAAGFDIITPYILAEMEKGSEAPIETTAQETTTVVTEDTSTETTAETTALQEVETTPLEPQQTNASASELKKGGCGSMVSSVSSVMILASILGLAWQKKKM